MSKKILRGASFGVSCGLMLLAMRGVASARAVPEIDPGSAASGIALLAGAALVMLERLRGR